MLEVRALYEEELARCRSSPAWIDWVSPTVANQHLRCTECGSDLIEQRDAENTDQEAMDLVCRNCGAEPEWDDVVVDAVDRALGGEAYIRAKDTGESGPIYDCQSCERHAYIEEEEACAVCGETFEYEQECVRCHAGIPLEDALAGFNEGLCSYCTYIANKDD